MTFDEALAKVAKLRALSQSSNANEAAAAAAAADRIMQQYRIETAQVEAMGAREDFPDDPITDEKHTNLWGDRIVHWQVQLMSALARQYSCKIVLGVRAFDGTHWKQGVHAFGRKSDLAIVRFQYAYLVVEVARLCDLNGKGKGRAWRNSYCMGAVQGIRDAMYQAKVEETATATSTALVLLDERVKLATAAQHSTYPKLGKARTGGSVRDHGAFAQGRRDGSGISQRSALPGRAQRLLDK
jgi:hypothetical protein